MNLIKLTKILNVKEQHGNVDQTVRSIAYDSRNVNTGSLFVAIKGFENDGHNFINDAIERGASSIVSENIPDNIDKKNGTAPSILVVPDTRKALAQISAEYYNHPSKEISTIGITGTNGKTTTTYLIDSIIKEANLKSGIIGTIGCKINKKSINTRKTTPESLDLQQLMRKMVSKKLNFCIMEVSSHALDLDRTLGTVFNSAIFTNLTQDHLDYHKTMENYVKAKEKLFTYYSPKNAVINIDDETGVYLTRKTTCPVITYGLNKKADISGNILSINYNGINMDVDTPSGKLQIHSHLIGIHNAYNILAAIGAGVVEGFTNKQIVKGVANLELVPGRFEPVKGKQPFTVLVDFAHTDDALKNAITALRSLGSKNIIVVFGCGGDRDRGKRANMGKTAITLSDQVIVTSDNPRTEDPSTIIKDIESGILSCKNLTHKNKSYKVIVDRKEAIKYALSIAKDQDIVLLAGKGHENYQIIGGSYINFDDRKIAKEFLSCC